MDDPNGVIVLHDFYGCKDTWSFARNFFNVKDFTYAFTEVRGYGGSRLRERVYSN